MHAMHLLLPHGTNEASSAGSVHASETLMPVTRVVICAHGAHVKLAHLQEAAGRLPRSRRPAGLWQLRTPPAPASCPQTWSKPVLVHRHLRSANRVFAQLV